VGKFILNMNIKYLSSFNLKYCCQVSRSNGPGGPLGLGLGIRSSPCLGVK
jgi:hypothetical protein